MNRPILIAYQLAIGFSDAFTGAMLIVAPEFTLRLLGLQASTDALPYLSFVGAFVFSVGLACLYGARGMLLRDKPCRLEVVWLLTAITRASVSVFLLLQVLTHTLAAGWLAIALFDGFCVAFQAIGLRKGWLAYVAR